MYFAFLPHFNVPVVHLQNHFTMKTSLSFLFCLFFILATYQLFAQCDVATAQVELNANNVRARLPHAGSLWWDGEDAQYIAPANGDVAALFAGGLWIGGIDDAGGMKFASSTYGKANGQTDYWPGPLAESSLADLTNCENFDRFWEMTDDDIAAHRADFEADGVVDGPIPQRVLAWPGQGNPNSLAINGFELPSYPHGLAPFVDVNADGTYNPQDGDYPDINNATAAQWYVFNDAGGIHTESSGGIFYVEVQVLAYAYASSIPDVNNATFYDYKVISRALESVNDVFFGLWVDPDLGCYLDDYIGCQPERDMMYVYNMDALDGVTTCDDCIVPTYCEAIPMLGIKLLSGPYSGRVFGENGTLEMPQIGTQIDTFVEIGMTNFMYYNNNASSPSPPPGTTDPESPIESYNLLTSRWADGTPLVTGGDGYDPASTDYTNFAFPDNPADPEGWSMCTAEMPAGDVRMVMGMGGMRMDPSSVNEFSFAVIFVEDVPHPCPDISVLEDAADVVEDFYEDNNPMTNTEEVVRNDGQVRMLPNPMTSSGQLVFPELGNQVESVSLYSINGQLLRQYAQIDHGQLTVDRGDLPTGLVIYKLTTKQAKVYTGKFLVQ